LSCEDGKYLGLKTWQKWHVDEVIMQHTYWLPQGFLWILHLNHQRTGCKLVQMLMNTTLTPWRLALHLVTGYHWPLAPAWRPILRVRRSLQCSLRHILHHTTWCASGGQFFPCARCYWL
jgi:hypothetical protein